MTKNSEIFLGCQEETKSDQFIFFVTLDMKIPENWKKGGEDTIEKLFFEPRVEDVEKATPALSFT